MRIRKLNGKIFGAELSENEKKAMDIEINRQIIEADREYQLDLNTLVLYTLYAHFGFGKKRLREFFLSMKQEHDDLINHYELEEEEFPWIARKKLLDAGVDVEKWVEGDLS